MAASPTVLAQSRFPGESVVTDLAPFSLPGRFLRGTLHTHGTASDGRRPVDQAVERCIARASGRNRSGSSGFDGSTA